MEITQLLRDTTNRFSSKSAIFFKGQSITFTDLARNVFNLASALHGLGVKKGDKVGIYLPNCPEYVYSYLAVFCLGATGVPLDYQLKSDELISCLSHAEAKFLIGKQNDVSLEDVQRGVSSLAKIILTDSFAGLLANAPDQFAPVAISEKDPALIMYTSGTTGKPKGILLNYRHLSG